MRPGTLFAAALAAMAATSAAPCAFHIYSPQPTLVELLLGSEHIVLARPSADDPFRYEPIEALEGGLDGVEIPHLVDTATRRKMDANPSDTVLFARDGAYGPWQRLAYVDATMEPVLDHVMNRLPDWEFGEDGDRFSYFAGLVGVGDPRLERVALTELDSADYGLLRDLDFEIDPVATVPLLFRPDEINLKPIRILLLGLSGDPNVASILEDGIDGNVGKANTFLGAYATALIELIGSEGVDRIASGHLLDSALPATSRELLVEAMAIHAASGAEKVKAAIETAVTSAVRADPTLAPMVARQWGIRADWSQVELLQDILKEKSVTAAPDLIALSQYVLFARQASELPGN